MDSVAIIAPVPQVSHTNFHHLGVVVAGGERIAGKKRGRGRNGESPVAQPEIVVLELQRPMRRERPFGASADQPAAGVVAAVGEVGEGPAGDRYARREVGDGQVVVADPAAASLAVHQPLIDGIAEAGRHCRDPATVVADLNGSNARNENPRAVVAAGPAKVPFAADDEVAHRARHADSGWDRKPSPAPFGSALLCSRPTSQAVARDLALKIMNIKISLVCAFFPPNEPNFALSFQTLGSWPRLGFRSAAVTGFRAFFIGGIFAPSFQYLAQATPWTRSVAATPFPAFFIDGKYSWDAGSLDEQDTR